MVDKLLWIGRLGMLALLTLFLWRLAAVLARDANPEAKASRRAQPASEISLRLLPGEHKVWVKAGMGEELLPPGSAVAVGSVLSIGRAPGNDLRLEDPFASAFHARIRRQRNGIVVEDLGATNGTKVNGVRIGHPVRAQDGDYIDIGSTSFAVEE